MPEHFAGKTFYTREEAEALGMKLPPIRTPEEQAADAGNPLPPSWMTKPPGMDGHDVTVNGDLVFQPGPNGVQVNGTRTDYPSLEVYQDTPDGRTQTIALDRAASGSSLGPAMNLSFHHDIGVGGSAFGPFTDWNNQDDVPGNPKPSTPFGPVTAPPTVPVQPVPKGTA